MSFPLTYQTSTIYKKKKYQTSTKKKKEKKKGKITHPAAIRHSHHHSLSHLSNFVTNQTDRNTDGPIEFDNNAAMAVHMISQEAFDDLVKESINDLSSPTLSNPILHYHFVPRKGRKFFLRRKNLNSYHT